ncbi:MAG: COG1615 family transporter [Methylacidiphilales bacterium]|nr:COG1615 family transporter [Candidatus Methylacidiphilales bacterium]
MKRSIRFILLLLGMWLIFDLASRLIAEVLWFCEVGYLQVFWLRLSTKLWLWIGTFFCTASFLLLNLMIARRFKYGKRGEEVKIKGEKLITNASSHLKLRFLFPAVIVLSGIASLVIVYYSQEVLRIWHPNLELPSQKLELLKQLQAFGKFLGFKQISFPILQAGFSLLITLAILVFHEFSLYALTFIFSSLLAFIFSTYWDKFLQFFNSITFNRSEPLFNLDISFYVFSLPILELLQSLFLGTFAFSIAAVGLIYLRSANSLSEGNFPGFSILQRLHLDSLGCLFMLSIALRYWLLRYSLLFSQRGVNYGASFTSVKVQLPIYTALTWLAIAIAFYLILRILSLYRAIKRKKTRLQQRQRTKSYFSPSPIPSVFPYPRHLIYFLAGYFTIAGASGEILPSLVQRFFVQPNELALELPYIKRTIALTRQAFKLDDIETETFAPQGTLTAADLKNNASTIRNIRLWDVRPLLDANRQLQQIRPYYKFPGADIDRYTLVREGGSEKQQTIIAARELDSTGLPEQAQTWVNRHLIYTHGYGFTLSPVNTIGVGGLPNYYVQDIGVAAAGQKEKASLKLSSEVIRNSIPIGQPRIYYGEISNNYVMTGTKTKELDYPSGGDNVYNVYDGRGGVSIRSLWRKLFFAEYLKDWQMLLTRNFTPQTKLLFRRNIKDRVRAIAPFLRYDRDPYLVAADGGGTTLTGEKTYLYWIIDAYTTSDRYPYSEPGNDKFNYIRNSVKVVVDAYNGSVNFYVADPNDPIITSLTKTFPNLFQPLDAIPPSLRTHIRYPLDLFAVQSDRLRTYHMTDPQVFYNREDLWEIPTEIYGSKPRLVEPYYLITELPTAKSEEFILLLPFTPTQRPNLIAWLAARSDGREYGKLLLYEFPKQQLVYGQEQIEALINQDPAISQQITLWNREGSRVIQGNLLVIPIEQSLLYVEPLYLEAEQNSVPTLVRVIVVYQNRIVMAETLEQALAAIFKPSKPTTPAIIRPVQ